MDFIALAQECAPTVARETIVAIMKHESNFNPFAIGINGRTRISRKPQTQEEAIEIAEKLIAAGVSIDMGLAQINNANLNKLGLSVAQVFDPCTNLRAAEKVLRWCYGPAEKKHGPGQTALQAALSCYNTGDFSRGLRSGYVSNIYKASR